MKRLFLVAMAAIATALLLSWVWRPMPYEERLVQLQVEQLLPEYAADLRNEPVELRAQFIDYAGDPLLVTKARLALLRYPEMARRILDLYGADAEFQTVLRDYGEHAIPPIHYFLTHDVRTVEWMKQAGETARAMEEKARRLGGERQAGPEEPAAARSSDVKLTDEERGWYAVLFIQDEGHSFLGQFAVRADGEVVWIQTERFLEGANALFFGGIRTLETKSRLDQPIELKDVGWAAADVAVGVGVLKVLRLGRSATVAGKSMNFSQRSLALSPALLKGSAVAARLAKYGAPVVVAYLALRHPSVLNSMLGLLAEAVGLPVLLVQALGWTLVLLPLLYLIVLLLRPLAAVLVCLGGGLRRLEMAMRW
jgi:hypothetical protein